MLPGILMLERLLTLKLKATQNPMGKAGRACGPGSIPGKTTRISIPVSNGGVFLIDNVLQWI